MAPTSATVQYEIDWAGLKRYVAEKEEYEHNFGAAAPLTNAEKAAILALIPPSKAPLEAATASNRNWIADLLHYLQIRYHTSELKFDDTAVPTLGANGKGTELKWRCSIKLPGDEGEFPCDGFGVRVDEPKPVFARKQDAKQHAARSACEYLVASNLMSPAGAVSKVVVASKRPTSTTTIPSETPSSFTADTTLPSKRQHPHDRELPPQRSVIPGLSNVAPGNDPRPFEESPSTRQVTEMAQSLKLPIPRYEYFADAGPGGTWSVRADFNNSPLPPPGLGAFSGVLTKKAAREKSAEAVLEWMVTVREDRDKVARDFLAE